ncbi:hypothetical protein [Microbacterium sp. LWO12-1.2]|uniref:hypothetical protein n=1 Tax=Microbacterium sp. LWO12-1.2 TaxID=3135261 RepID=UPI003418AC43
MLSPAESYAQYEDSLAALLAVPTRVAHGLSSAQHQHEAQRAAADDAFQRQLTRLANLRNSVQGRYEAVVATLTAHEVLLPPHVRPDARVPGDEDALKQAMEAHAEAVSAVDVQIRVALAASQRESEDAVRRAADARKTADALRVRQDRIRAERERAVEEARLAGRAGVRRRRLWSVGVTTAAVALIIIVVIVVITLNE